MDKTPRPTAWEAPTTPRPTRVITPRPTNPPRTPRPTATYLATTPEPTEDQSGWGAGSPSKDRLHCCKDQVSKKDCLSNHEESCSWLDADAALAKRFGTRCLKESFVRNDES